MIDPIDEDTVKYYTVFSIVESIFNKLCFSTMLPLFWPVFRFSIFTAYLPVNPGELLFKSRNPRKGEKVFHVLII